ncbi:hypothetical protein GA0074692_4174 [Micromonospora pallida]|uniref:Uncharacterized protein n=1 Tax=Micromonospora pallida TaxID=145854 RepID=A0A1C6T1P7_9ACTN|nr:hypothetical protein GA0074692_4174 [Micromonospora pallida]
MGDLLFLALWILLFMALLLLGVWWVYRKPKKDQNRG